MRVLEIYDESTNLTQFVQEDKLEGVYKDLKDGKLEIVEEYYITEEEN